MKNMLIASIMILWSISSLAQFNSLITYSKEKPVAVSPLFAPPSLKMRISDEHLAPGYRMKRVGGTLVLGGAFLIIGGKLASQGLTFPLGPLMMVGGVGILIPGLIIWPIGEARYNRYVQQNMLNPVIINLKSSGLTLSYTF